MASKQEVVLWANSQRVSHERSRVDGQCGGELSRDTNCSEASVHKILQHTIDYLVIQSDSWFGELRSSSATDRSKGQTYISGSFCVSRTAAMGIPKFDTGPQKSMLYFCQHVVLIQNFFLFLSAQRSIS